MKRPAQYQHESLRVPNGWNAEDKSLIIQLESILDDIYWRIGTLRDAMKKMQEDDENASSNDNSLQP